MIVKVIIIVLKVMIIIMIIIIIIIIIIITLADLGEGALGARAPPSVTKKKRFSKKILKFTNGIKT